jgi:hypothetical protein
VLRSGFEPEVAMPWKYSVLVVANVTAGSDELFEALRDRAERDSVRFTLLVPATGGGRGGREAARQRMDEAVERMRSAGLEVESRIGDSDPMIAVHDAWDPREYDEIVVSTLPTQASKWLQVDAPHRIERITGVPVKHVVSQEPRREPAGEPPPKRERWGVLAPLRALGWGADRERSR